MSRGKDAGSVDIGHIGATEDAAARRPTRSGGTDLILKREGRERSERRGALPPAEIAAQIVDRLGSALQRFEALAAELETPSAE